MRRVYAPHLGKHIVVGGCRVVDHHAPKLKLGSYLKSAPTLPSSCDWTPAAISVIRDPLGNDKYGDCVIAEDGHAIAVIITLLIRHYFASLALFRIDMPTSFRMGSHHV